MSSIVFRNNIIRKYPKWYYSTYMNDDTLFVMLSKYGKAKMINEICSVYRENNEGVSKKNFSFEKDYKGRIQFYKDLNKYLDFKFKKQIKHLLSLYYFKLYKLYLRENNYLAANKALFFIFYFDNSVILQKLKNK